MSRTRAVVYSMLSLALCVGISHSALAEAVRSTFVSLGRGVPGVIYEPVTPGPKSAIAVFVMHSEGDYLQFSACTELSKRGYRVLCANNATRKGGIDSDLNLDSILMDAKLAVSWLRRSPGVRKVVLLGHSGGGTLMAAYQSIAENGLKACQGPEKIIRCSDGLAGLPAADGLMLLDSNYGLGAMLVFSLDPAVSNETSGRQLAPSLDLFNPANGFRPGEAHYTPEFIQRFQGATAYRNNELVRTALDRLTKLEAGQGSYSDDEPLVVPGGSYLGFNNKLFTQDTHLLAHTHKAWPLLKGDGSTVVQIVPSVRVPENMTSNTASFQKGALRTTVRNFLHTLALRVSDDFAVEADSIHGLDWSSSYALPAGSVRTVTVPLLTLGMTGHWEYLAAEIIYENAKSADKSIAFVEGATHSFTPCTACEKTPGQFGDTLKTTYDYVDQWLSRPGRF